MEVNLKEDLLSIAKILDLTREHSLSFLNHLADIPTSAADQEVDVSVLPETGWGALRTMETFREQFQKLIVSAPGPRYWGYVVGGVTPAALSGDWLASAFDQNTQSVHGHGDVSAIVERQTVDLMKNLLGLPDRFHGGFVSGATMSNFTCLGVARQWAGKQLGVDIAGDGLSVSIPVYSAVPHSSSLKCLAMLGVGSRQVIRVPTLNNREAMNVPELERLLGQNTDHHPIVIASAGTVNSVDFDDFQKLAELKTRFSFWLHIDAAFGGFAACSDDFESLLKGWEWADSITIDCHKWMNVPYDSALFLVAKEHGNQQIATFQNSDAPYLGDPNESFSYLNFLPENSRRFRALPAWFSLMAYGKSGFQWIVENSVARANEFGSFVSAHHCLELVAPVRLNVVCFSHKEAAQNATLLERLNNTGQVFMTPSVVLGKKCIRAAFVNYRTTSEDVQLVAGLLEEILNGEPS